MVLANVPIWAKWAKHLLTTPRKLHISLMLHGAQSFFLKDGRNALIPWLEVDWCQPLSKPISFFVNPFTLKGGQWSNHLLQGMIILWQGVIYVLLRGCQQFLCNQLNLWLYWVLLGLIASSTMPNQERIWGPLTGIYFVFNKRSDIYTLFLGPFIKLEDYTAKRFQVL